MYLGMIWFCVFVVQYMYLLKHLDSVQTSSQNPDQITP